MNWIYEAKTEELGRVLKYSETRLDRAIEHLETVAESSPSGRVLEDTYWLLGKAHLMKQDPDRAVEALTEVEQLDGRRAGEARQSQFRDGKRRYRSSVRSRCGSRPARAYRDWNVRPCVLQERRR